MGAPKGLRTSAFVEGGLACYEASLQNMFAAWLQRLRLRLCPRLPKFRVQKISEVNLFLSFFCHGRPAFHFFAELVSNTLRFWGLGWLVNPRIQSPAALGWLVTLAVTGWGSWVTCLP